MSNFCKYYKQKKQVSYNGGWTWEDVSPAEYQAGGLYEVESSDCQDILQNRWVAIPGDFLCENKNMYEREIGQYSIDGGETWEYYYPSIFRLGRLLESNSDLCNNKWEGYYYQNGNNCASGYRWVEGRGCVAVRTGGGGSGGDGSDPLYFRYRDPVKYIRCSSSTSTTLTDDDVRYNPYKLYEGIIGDCVTSIDSYAFQNCTSLTSCTIGSGVTTIGTSAFEYCSGLITINIPNGVTSIGDYAFRDCHLLTGITIPSGVTNIKARTFENCYRITDITIPDSVTTIGLLAFDNCRSLTSCTIGSGVTSFTIGANGETVFTGCTSLSELTIKSSVGYRWFAELANPVSITLGSSVNEIGQAGFASSNIKRINSNTDGVANLNVTSIGLAAFKNCSGFTTLVISSRIRSISGEAFSYCTGLTSITVEAATPPTLVSNALTYTNNCPIYVPSGSVNTYKSASGWSVYSSRIQAIPT